MVSGINSSSASVNTYNLSNSISNIASQITMDSAMTSTSYIEDSYIPSSDKTSSLNQDYNAAAAKGANTITACPSCGAIFFGGSTMSVCPKCGNDLSGDKKDDDSASKIESASNSTSTSTSSSETNTDTSNTFDTSQIIPTTISI